MKLFTCHFWFAGWDCLSLGVHVCFSLPNIEIHLPFGFCRIGWEKAHRPMKWRVCRMGSYGIRGFGWMS